MACSGGALTRDALRTSTPRPRSSSSRSQIAAASAMLRTEPSLAASSLAPRTCRSASGPSEARGPSRSGASLRERVEGSSFKRPP